MADDPYAPPKSKVTDVLPDAPRGALRWKYWSLAGLILFTALIFWIPKGEALSYWYLALFCAIAGALALVTCWEIWTLRAKLAPRWVSNLSISCSVAAVATLLALQETRVFVWNHLYIEIPFALFWALTMISAWVTEWRKGVLVFAVRGGFAFMPATRRN